MHEFSVWAPNAREVSVVVNGVPHPMHRDGEYFRVSVPAQPGDRYGFSLDGGPVLADPRSQAQPDGVFGLSQLVDPAFEWTAPAFQPSFDVIYELHVGTFGGDFAGVAKRLKYLRDLGVTAIELMPVQPFPGTRNWGYDGVFWHAVHEGYGGPRALKQLIDAAHNHGLAVILDVVYNHFGPEGNTTNQFGPYTVSEGTGWGDAVNLKNPEVRRYVRDAARRWLTEFRADGLRLDATHSFTDPSILAEFAELPGFIIAEDLQEIADLPVDAQWNDTVHHTLHVAVSGERFDYYADYGDLADLRINYPSVVYTTTHDQVGNRPRGDRPSMTLSPQKQLLKIAVAAALDAQLMMFMGEEYGAHTPFPFFCDHQTPSVREGTRSGRLAIFAEHGMDDEPLDPLAAETFEAAVLNFDGPEEVSQGYREILRLRREHRIGPAELDVEGNVVFIRGAEYGLVANFSDVSVALPAPMGEVLYRTAGVGEDEACGLAPWSAAWLRLSPQKWPQK